MKNILLLLLVLAIGDCALLTKGVFKGQYWRIIAVNEGGTFDIKDLEWTLKGVKGGFLEKAESGLCREPI